MLIVRRPSPLGELMSLRSAMDRLFDDRFIRRPFGLTVEETAFPIDATMTADGLVLEAALPGVKPADVDITVEDGVLAIRGTYRDERHDETGRSLVSEIHRGTVSRAISMPTGLDADKATATFENGVLSLRIPKADSAKPRQIRISPTIEGASVSTPVEASANGQTAVAAGVDGRG